MDPDVFLAHRESHGVVTQHKKVVRGIALRTTAVAIDRWVEMLTDSTKIGLHVALGELSHQFGSREIRKNS